MLHKLYRKHEKANSKESQQAMAVLKAGKLEDNNDSSQKLIASLNRGVLSSLTLPAQKILVKLESLFRQLTPNVNLQGINLSGITQKAITDSDILSNFDKGNYRIKPDNHVRKDVLFSTVKLYVRVRAFSMSKDVIQRYKLQSKQTKSKSLRKEMTRSHSAHNGEQPRQD